MKLFNALGGLTVALNTALSLAASSSSIPTIDIIGNKFFFSNNGSQFYMKGIAYQADSANATAGDSFTDPLADGDSCQRDLPYLKELETNVIRVYAINTTLDHSDCINLFADNGIYIIADLSEPGLSIDRNDPAWTVDLFNRYTSVVDTLQGFDSVLGFFAGNEVTNNNTNTDASPFVKAAIRDTKSYIKEKGYRAIPVGYSSNDDSDTRTLLAQYFTCGDSSEAADFYGINMYEWCGASSFEESGYQARTEEFSNFTVPVFFSEYGCNVIQPRKFTEVAALYGENMTDVWSGGIVYMYFEETNNYGLVTVSGSSVSTLTDFDFLSSELAAVSPTSVQSSDFTPSNTVAPDCPASTLSAWKGSSDLPPTPNEGVCQCAVDSLSCIVADDVSEDDYSDLFDYVCAQISCDGINANGTSGEYGAYSFCSPKEKLSFVLNLYYVAQGSKSDACSFSGSATLGGAATTAKACSAVLEQAGSSGTGVVTAAITASADAESSGSSSGGSSSPQSSGSSSGSASGSSTAGKSAASTISAGFKTTAVLLGCVTFAFALIL